MHVPAALEQWAAQHNDQLSEDTIAEVRRIADAIAASELANRAIDDLGPGFVEGLDDVFPPARAERAATLVDVVAAWARKSRPAATESADSDANAASAAGQTPRATLPTESSVDSAEPTQSLVPDERSAREPIAETAAPTPTPEELDRDAVALRNEYLVSDAAPEPAQSSSDHIAIAPAPADEPGPVFAPAPPIAPERVGDQVEAPAFLRSDRIDEEDDVRLYGPRRPWKAIFGTLFALALLAGAVALGWYWFTQRDNDPETIAAPTQVTPEPEVTEGVTSAPTTAPTVEPTPAPQPTPEAPAFWADTTPILNSGSSQISASTYVVSPANRAVLTGHTAAITGIAIADDGRVLTSGADRRLVDWGADVTLANPDVLNVPSPLTVLERTRDQRLLAGDAAGNVTIIDLVNATEPTILPIHDVAISALTELADGRLVVASVDGDVAVFDLASPENREILEHEVEVTAVVGLDDGTVATAAVDGTVRLWNGDGDPGEISTLASPVTALALLGDGTLAMASVEGTIHIVEATAGASPTVQLPGHVGAVRALLEIVLPDGVIALASGGDDTTIRLWDLDTTAEIGVLEGHGDIISGLDVLPDGRLVSASGDGTGRVWDLTVEPSRRVIPPHDWNLSAIHPWGNDQFVTGGTDGKVVLASTAETSEPVDITRHEAPVVGLSVLEGGDIISVDAASVLRVNQPAPDPDTQIEVQLAPGATALDLRLGDEDDDPSESGVGNVGIVTGHADGSVRFHDLSEEIAVVEAHGSGVNDVVALRSGLVASAGQDTTVRIIDPENPDQIPVFDLHTGPVDVVIELPDGRIASAGSDGIYIYTVDGLAQDHVRLNGQRSRTISLVALSGDRLISTGDDGRVRLWDLTTPEAEPTTLVDIPGIVNPHLIQAENGLFVAGAARGYVVFTLS